MRTEAKTVSHYFVMVNKVANIKGNAYVKYTCDVRTLTWMISGRKREKCVGSKMLGMFNEPHLNAHPKGHSI